MIKYTLPLLLLIVLSFSCSKEEDNKPKTISIVSNGSLDGYIVNSPNRVVHDYAGGAQGKEIRIGWNNEGYAMRGFLSFDISRIIPVSNKKLVVEDAKLFLYESNTNLHPFDGDNGNRSVYVHLISYGTDITSSDFASIAIVDCGVIVSQGYNVLQEYSLSVASELQEYLSQGLTNKIQFRLQFTNDDNIVDTDNSELDGSMWNTFSGDEDYYNSDGTDFRPRISITYKYE